MSLSLATICNRIAAMIALSPTPANWSSSRSEGGRRMVQAVNEACADLADMHDWQVLVGEASFTLVEGVASYALPDGLAKVRGAWLQGSSQQEPLIGPLSAQQWTALKYGQYGYTSRYVYRVAGNAFNLWPVPTENGETINYDGVTNHWAATGPGSGKAWMEADTDVCKLPDLPTYRLAVAYAKRAFSFDFDIEMQAAMATIERAMGKDGVGVRISLGGEVHGGDMDDAMGPAYNGYPLGNPWLA